MGKLKKWAERQPDALHVICEINLSLHEVSEAEFSWTYKSSTGEDVFDLKEAELESSTVVDFARSALNRSGQMAYLLEHRHDLMRINLD